MYNICIYIYLYIYSLCPHTSAQSLIYEPGTMFPSETCALTLGGSLWIGGHQNADLRMSRMLGSMMFWPYSSCVQLLPFSGVATLLKYMLL